MKYFILALVLCVGTRVGAQNIPSEISKAKNATFYGLDFSFLRLIHEDGFVDKNGKPMCKSLTFKYFAEWNDLFLIEREKFNVTRYFAIPKYTIDMAVVTERNKAYAFEEGCIIQNENYAIDQADIEAAVRTLVSANAEGLGVVAYVESFNKTAGRCNLICVFFDTKDQRIIYQFRTEGAPEGSGFRNYWVNSINNAMGRDRGAFSKARKGN